MNRLNTDNLQEIKLRGPVLVKFSRLETWKIEKLVKAPNTIEKALNVKFYWLIYILLLLIVAFGLIIVFKHKLVTHKAIQWVIFHSK